MENCETCKHSSKEGDEYPCDYCSNVQVLTNCFEPKQEQEENDCNTCRYENKRFSEKPCSTCGFPDDHYSKWNPKDHAKKQPKSELDVEVKCYLCKEMRPRQMVGNSGLCSYCIKKILEGRTW